MIYDGSAWYCGVFDGIGWYSMVLHGTQWYSMVLHCIEFTHLLGWVGFPTLTDTSIAQPVVFFMTTYSDCCNAHCTHCRHVVN